MQSDADVARPTLPIPRQGTETLESSEGMDRVLSEEGPTLPIPRQGTETTSVYQLTIGAAATKGGPTLPIPRQGTETMSKLILS